MSEPAVTGLSVSNETATTPAGRQAAIAAFEGDLDLATIPEFEDAVGAGGEADLIVDLSGVRFIDSSGIHAVVRAQMARAERRLGIELVVAPDSAVDRVLEMSGLRERLLPKASRDAALAALDPAPANGAAS